MNAISTTSRVDPCCQGDSAGSSGAGSTTPRLLSSVSPMAWLYLGLLVGLYISVLVYAVVSGASPWAVATRRGFEHDAIASGPAAVFTAVRLAAGEMLTELMPYWFAGMLLAGALMTLATWPRLAACVGFAFVCAVAAGMAFNLVAA